MQTAPPIDYLTDPIGPIKKAVAGRYEIQREIGQGAFATVYLARDLRHDRQVAFKVLNADPSSETGELRFLREIRLLARLQHPNILPLIDSGHADAMLYYVMPYVSGETLRKRMLRERQMPIDAAVAITREAADALAYAHEKGVIHRDIKPENILLSAGHPVIADFGIARAIDVAGVRTLTRTGIGSPGTPAYMSPEQLMGDKEVDRRTDIYSLGAVLFEALTGKPPFTGKDGLVKRFTEPPPLPSLARDRLPPDIDDIVTKAMAREPNDRYSSASDFAEALNRAHLVPLPVTSQPPDRRVPGYGPPSETSVEVAATDARLESDGARAHSRRVSSAAPALVPDTSEPASDWTIPDNSIVRDDSTRHRRWLRSPWIAAAAVASAIAAIILIGMARFGSREAGASDAKVRRWGLVLPDSAPLAYVGVASLGIGRPSLALAPDGTSLVYSAKKGATTQLYYRELDKLDAVPLAGTEGAYSPFFSPDGRWVAFLAGSYLKKISVPDGQIVTVARVNDPMGGAWSADGRRILVPDFEGGKPSWVASAGGTLQEIPLKGATPRQWRYPHLLPNGQWALHTDWDGSLSLSSVASLQGFAITADGVTPRESTDVSKLIFGTHPVYLATGHIVYLSGGGILMALPFDADNRTVLGPPAPVLQGVRQEAEAGAGQYAVANDGTLIYAPGVDAGISKLVWVDTRGRVDTLPFPPAAYGGFDLSPNGKDILIRVQPASGRAELRILDLEKEAQTRITTPGIPLTVPRWWPDGRQILISEFTAAGGLAAPVVRQSPARAGKGDTVVAAATAYGVSPDGRRLAVTGWRLPGLWVLPLDATISQPVQLTSEAVSFPVFSPDGRWMLFSARDPEEVYVASSENPAERHRISTDGGEEALWSPKGDQIIYRNRQQFLGVDVSTKNGFHASRPRVLFEGTYLNVPGWSHAIAPDGRHLVLVSSQEQSTNRLVVVTNWFAEVRRLAPAGGK
jgi:serine/threonine protein kinase/Tol biopolymer transport system component